MTFDNGIYIDGTYYHVPILSCGRSADILWKYAERTEDGIHRGEILGVYFNYELKFGSIGSKDEYNRLYTKLTEPNGYHTVSMPSSDGTMFTYSAYFANISDAIKRSKNGVNIFKDLKVKFVSQAPSRK